MPTKETKFKIVPISDLPTYVPQTAQTQRWVELFKSIPEGNALVSTEKELGIKVATLKGKVPEYMKRGWIPKGYRIRQRKHGDTIDIFIIHEAVKERKGVVE